MPTFFFITHYANRGGTSYNGDVCGTLSVVADRAYSLAHWGFGAALSFKLITHYHAHSGCSVNGTECGVFCVYSALGDSRAYWNYGAALK